MGTLFDCLPGVLTPVAKVTDVLAHMWDVDAPNEQHPLGYRASQMNLLLHLGMSSTEAEAQTAFHGLIRFAQRYPCRIVVLCPGDSPDPDNAYRSKIFSQCYLGNQLREACCCEALVLSYPPDEYGFLESQVSLWLESDLPVYNWFQHVPPPRIECYYHRFLKRSRRLLYDRSCEGALYDGIAWPSPARVSDLAAARTLPLRQHLGQFLSGFSPSLLVGGLKTLQLRCAADFAAETHHLLAWHRRAIANCAGVAESALAVEFCFVEDNSPAAATVAVSWCYTDPQDAIEWRYDRAANSGRIRLRVNGVQADHSQHIEPLPLEAVLAEALFFAS